VSEELTVADRSRGSRGGASKERRKPGRGGQASGPGVGLRRRRALRPTEEALVERRRPGSWKLGALDGATRRSGSGAGSTGGAPARPARRARSAGPVRQGRQRSIFDPRSRSKTPRRWGAVRKLARSPSSPGTVGARRPGGCPEAKRGWAEAGRAHRQGAGHPIALDGLAPPRRAASRAPVRGAVVGSRPSVWVHVSFEIDRRSR